MEKTAVEWFTQELDKRYCVILNYSEYQKLLKQAKEMEKQQIVEAAMWMPEPFSNIEFIPELAKQYYNDKYGRI